MVISPPEMVTVASQMMHPLRPGVSSSSWTVALTRLRLACSIKQDWRGDRHKSDPCGVSD